MRQAGSKRIRTEVVTDQVLAGWDLYADLLLFAAMAEQGQPAVAEHWKAALRLWDGKGFLDPATRQSGRYATYKLALALIAANRLSASADLPAGLLDRLLAVQADSGGWITDYNASGERIGQANVETTCFAILGLEAVNRRAMLTAMAVAAPASHLPAFRYHGVVLEASQLKYRPHDDVIYPAVVRVDGRIPKTGALALVSLAYASSGCGGSPAKAPADAPPADAADASLPPPAYEAALPEAVRGHLFEKFTGDFDQMVARRLIRVGTTFNRTFYFVDHGVQRGMAYELGMAFEEQLNKKLKTTNATKVSVTFVPLTRDALASALMEGKVDCVVAQVIIRPELGALVDFTNPTRTNVSEVVVSGPGAPAIASVDDLSGKDVYARKDSSAWQSLVALNDNLKGKGRAPVVIREVPGNLEDRSLS